ncbi:LysR family transcriptional regulator [Goodfellowiella coeruleoviolacea]|uniref:DNA-binding transcriptional regulator, LysR family n=1 Tax=Goodfellowiella coeruleoviolacea TaxID=334858 RepID=A0AAE3GAL4_9PSEU|nr:LysR family transcriptional regulator [Goodfellowiella coeruleoviolacea]MCP2164762.1 DNA-binding transcriptional regulator, LysR family [Goodfellowiella coeruleoviolacea]
MLDVRRLRLLAEFAARGTVAATARALHLPGPAVSQQLAALEREAGTALFEKQGRNLRLTSAGQLLVDHARVVLGDLAAAEAELAALRQGRRGTVRIAAFPSAARVLVPLLWPEPGTAEADDWAPLPHLVEHEPAAAEAALQQHTVDIAVTQSYSLLPRPLPPACERRPLLDEPVFLAVHPAHAANLGLAPGAEADLTWFADAAWLLSGQGTPCRELTHRACGAAGFVPRPVAEASDFAVLAALVARGAGVTLIPRLALPEPTRELSLHPLRTPLLRHIHVLHRAGTGRHPDIQRTLRRLDEVARIVTARYPTSP